MRSANRARLLARLVWILGILWAAPSRAEVTIHLPPRPVPATEGFEWEVPIQVKNGLDRGVYGDSLVCESEDLDPGESRTGRRRTTTDRDLSRTLGTLSRLDSTVVRYRAIAFAERARLTFRLYTHTADGETHVSHGACETAPGLVSKSFPSVFIERPEGRIETVLIPEPWPTGKSPGLLMVHGEGNHARRLLPLAWHLANRGVTVMLVSQPGYGLSEGAPDFAGPSTIRALELALDRLRRHAAVDSNRIAVWGISRGATAAALLAARRPDLAAVILQSGIYDPRTAARDTQDDSLRRVLADEAGGPGGWKRRSALQAASRIRPPVLFLHGEADPFAPSNQAVDLAAKLRVAGREVELSLIPGAGHALPASTTSPLAESFLKRRIGMTK